MNAETQRRRDAEDKPQRTKGVGNGLNPVSFSSLRILPPRLCVSAFNHFVKLAVYAAAFPVAEPAPAARSAGTATKLNAWNGYFIAWRNCSNDSAGPPASQCFSR